MFFTQRYTESRMAPYLVVAAAFAFFFDFFFAVAAVGVAAAAAAGSLTAAAEEDSAGAELEGVEEEQALIAKAIANTNISFFILVLHCYVLQSC